MSIEVNLSVHTLVDFLLRRGSIDTRVFNLETMQEGTRLHSWYQKRQDGSYESEVPLQCEIEYEEFIFHLQGRADGVITKGNEHTIDEIKSTNDELEHFYLEQGEWHLGQAICYGYMYCLEHQLDEIQIQLTYLSQVNNESYIKKFVFPFPTLKQKVYSYLEKYVTFYRILADHQKQRNITSGKIEFPYPSFRKGQREVAKYVYKTATDGGLFFFEAPTGTGKTMSALYPTIKTFYGNKNEKIFYLSAKIQAKEVAFDAMKTLTLHGLDAYSIVLSSKEQMCQCEAQKCNPDECPFAKDYYNKINGIITSILTNEKNISKETIFAYSLSHGICPFECQLDVSTYCDVIICDYNYLFDPIVYLKRFFEEGKTNYFALIDEAHNLSERTKDMFTSAIDTDILYRVQSSFKKKKAIGFKRALRKVLAEIQKVVTPNEYEIIEKDFPSSFYNELDNLFTKMKEISKEAPELVDEEFSNCSTMVYRFLKIHEFIDTNFVTYIEKKENVSLYIRCIDSASLIKDTFTKIRGAVLFSATLTPIEYYMNTCGGENDTPYLKLSSPFEKENLCLLVRDDLSTKYKDRDHTYQDIADSISAVVEQKVGNYLVFFSSYQYLQNVYNCFQYGDEDIVIQKKEMSLKDREEFLSHFKENPQKTTIGFAVLGGAFSEGIDLPSDRLIGAIIVGVGLPMVSFERDLIKDYYNKKNMNGFDYSYTNPGKNKVMQAAGRVIRSENDRGVVLLIDQRFREYRYKDLFRLEWSHYISVRSTDRIRYIVHQFWEEKE